MVCSADGYIFYAEPTGELKLVLPNSPGPSFKIKFIAARSPDGFIIADDKGRFKIYHQSGEPKSPYNPYKDIPTTVDSEKPWFQQLSKLEYEPNFPISGFCIVGDYIYYVTESR